VARDRAEKLCRRSKENVEGMMQGRFPTGNFSGGASTARPQLPGMLPTAGLPQLGLQPYGMQLPAMACRRLA